MNRTRIKICGIREKQHIAAAVDAGADYIGVVMVPESPRHVTIDVAKKLTQSIPDHVVSVGLFVDVPPSPACVLAKNAGIQAVQLHGSETIAHLDDLDEFAVWKALPFNDKLTALAKPWEDDPRTQALLIDTPPTSGLTGGSGIAFDWEGLAAIKDQFTKPIVLAGGLTPDNVGEAIKTVRPYAVDVSSGVESSRGVKDVGLIKAFCEAVRQTDMELD